MFPAHIHKHIYFWSAMVMVFGLPLGEFFMSVGSIAFVANWLLEGNIGKKLNAAFNQPLVMALTALFGLHLFGLLWTDDLPFALHDLKIKLPILILPICFASHRMFSPKQIEHILKFFVLSTLISILVSFYTYFKLNSTGEAFDLRDISIFISHIRQSMMVVFSIVLLFYFMQQKWFKGYVILPLILVFVAYLFLLQSLTGIALLMLMLVLLPLWWFGFGKKAFAMSLVLFLALIATSLHTGKDAYSYYFVPKEHDFSEKTAQGNLYEHNMQSQLLANGYYVYRNLAEEELKQAWRKRTGENLSGKKFYQVLRYVTSKGLTKDAEGVKQLSDNDLQNIENGATSALETKGLQQRIYSTMFEIAAYKDGQNPSHNSVTQRLFAWKLGTQMLLDNMWIGLGTGGTKLAYDEAYDNSVFNFGKRIRAHNQFLTFFISFGLMGGFLCFVVLAFPFTSFKNNSLALMFYVIVFLSFFVEDTLETQPGVLFFSFFIGLFFQERLLLKPSLQ